MTAEPMAAGSDPHRLLAHVQHLTRRVRVAQRVTWLPLLVLAAATFLAFPAARFGWRVTGCVTIDAAQVCHGRNVALIVDWQVALAVSYAAIAYGYVRAARARGLGARVLPYVVTGVALNVLVQAVFVPPMVIQGGVLLLGGLGFALAQRRQRHR